MMLTDILYWNQYTSLVEPFKGSDKRNAKNVRVYDRTFMTKAIAEKLFLDGELTFKTKNTLRNMINNPAQLMETALTEPMAINRFRIFELHVVKETVADDSVDFFLEESYDEEEAVPVGWLKLQRNLQTPIGGHRGKSAVIIHDVAMNSGTMQANQALGTLACAMAVYVLWHLDGDWERIGKQEKDLDADPELLIQRLKQEISTKDALIAELRAELGKARTEIKIRVDAEKAEIRRLRTQLKKTRH